MALIACNLELEADRIPDQKHPLKHTCMKPVRLIILAAVAEEIQGLIPVLRPEKSFHFLGETFFLAQRGEKAVILGTTGLGKVNGATVVSALAQEFGPEQVWNIGCAGAYREGPLRIGDVLISTETLLGDEGILCTHGTASTRSMGIPIVKRNHESFFDALPLLRQEVYQELEKVTPPGIYTARGKVFTPEEAPGSQKDPADQFRVIHGSSLTVSLVSGDRETAAQRFRQHGALSENMEGSGIAQACYRHDVPMMECRGMSNLAGERDKRFWNFPMAFAHCHAIVFLWLKHLNLN